MLERTYQRLRPSEIVVDSATNCFYVFKSFPETLSTKQKKNWAELQSQALSPFDGGDRYFYLSEEGLHLWLSRDKLNGLPETAAQAALSDGQHLASGLKHQYQQTWLNGIMLECITVPETLSVDIANQVLDFAQPWATESQLRNEVRSPTFWATVATILFLMVLVWFGSGAITLIVQAELFERQNKKLDPIVTSQLDQRTRLVDQQQVLKLVNDWHQEYGFLPESLSVLVEHINPLGTWEIKRYLGITTN